MQGTDVGRLCTERGWTRARLMLELRKAAGSRDERLPEDENLSRMIRQWISGKRGLSERSAELLTMAFGINFESVDREIAVPDIPDEFAARLNRANISLDPELITLFGEQTQSFRMIDRRLGARRLLVQTESHVNQMTDILMYSLAGPHRAALGEALAQGASLAGWQALDMGRPDKAWALYETAKHAARESGNLSLVAHVSAEQAYALLDFGRPDDAVSQIRHARTEAGDRIPAILRGWLLAAEAETLAAAGGSDEARSALDQAAVFVASGEAEKLPYLALDEVHFARWRGHCLARMGASEAVEDLTSALGRLDPTFARARAGLLCDLAIAHSARGEHDTARKRASEASLLADSTSSARQRKRIDSLLTSGSGKQRK